MRSTIADRATCISARSASSRRPSRAVGGGEVELAGTWDHRRVKRLPRPALRPFVETLWAMDEAAPARASGRREHVIPTGRMHLVFRLSDDPCAYSSMLRIAKVA